MTDTVVYAYPWDLSPETDGAAWLGRLGADRVAIAAAYHAVRAATPRHPRHRVVDASASALYTGVRAEVWRGRRLAPADPAPWAGEDPFRRARDAARTAGVAVDAWLVLTHRDAADRPDDAAATCQQDVLGGVRPYALCPARDEVREHVRTLVGEALEGGEPDGLVVEACGPMGLGHAGVHDKLAGADWDADALALLSTCWCGACRADYRAADVDDQAAATAVRAALADDATPDVRRVALETVAPVWDVRRAQARRLLGDVAEVTFGRLPLRVHATTAPRAAGPFTDLVPTAEVTGYVAPCWDGGADDVAATRAAAGTARVGAYVTVVGPSAPDASDLRSAWRPLVDAGADELHLYHLGLASGRRLAAAAEALDHHPTLEGATRGPLHP